MRLPQLQYPPVSSPLEEIRFGRMSRLPTKTNSTCPMSTLRDNCRLITRLPSQRLSRDSMISFDLFVPTSYTLPQSLTMWNYGWRNSVTLENGSSITRRRCEVTAHAVQSGQTVLMRTLMFNEFYRWASERKSRQESYRRGGDRGTVCSDLGTLNTVINCLKWGTEYEFMGLYIY